ASPRRCAGVESASDAARLAKNDVVFLKNSPPGPSKWPVDIDFGRRAGLYVFAEIAVQVRGKGNRKLPTIGPVPEPQHPRIVAEPIIKVLEVVEKLMLPFLIARLATQFP